MPCRCTGGEAQSPARAALAPTLAKMHCSREKEAGGPWEEGERAQLKIGSNRTPASRHCCALSCGNQPPLETSCPLPSRPLPHRVVGRLGCL